jgi:hypothetical protein
VPLYDNVNEKLRTSPFFVHIGLIESELSSVKELSTLVTYFCFSSEGRTGKKYGLSFREIDYIGNWIARDLYGPPKLYVSTSTWDAKGFSNDSTFK